MWAGAKIQSMSDYFLAQNSQQEWKAPKPQRRWESRQRALSARSQMKRDRSPEEDVDPTEVIRRGTLGRSPCPRRCAVRCLPAQFSIRRQRRKFRRREFHRCARNRSARFGVFLEATAEFRYRRGFLSMISP